MSYAGTYSQFLDVEEELDLFAVEVDGIPVWERVRLPVFREILQGLDSWGQQIQEVEKSVPNLLKGGYLLARNVARRNPFLARPADLLFFGFSRRKKMADGTYWDLFCDPLYEAVDFDYLHLEEPHLLGHRRPARTDRLRYLDLVEYSGTIQRALGLADVAVPDPQRQVLERAAARLGATFDVTVDVVDRVSFRLSLRRSTLPMYRALIRRIDPELVFVVVSNHKETFVEACKERDVPVVELQHGVLTKYEYDYPGTRTKEAFPDYVFTFGPYWNDRVALPVPDENVRAVGYAHFDRQRARFATAGDTDGLVFISQGNVGEALSRAAVELSRRPSFDGDVVYKLHPGEYGRWREDYPWLEDADLRVVGEEGPDLYEVFADVSAQVGVYSTAIYEGLGFGLRTFLYDLPGVEELIDLRDAGHARLVSTPDELATHISDPHTRRGDPAAFFAPDPVENFCDAVRDIAVEQGLDVDIEGPGRET